MMIYNILDKPCSALNPNIDLGCRNFRRHHHRTTLRLIFALLCFAGAQAIADEIASVETSFTGEIPQDSHADNIFGSTKPISDLAVSPASSHNLFDGNEGLSAGEIDSGAATSCNDVTEACSTEEVTIELEHGHTQNDGDGDLGGSNGIPLSSSGESINPEAVMLTQKPTIEGSTLEPDSQQAAIVLTKEKSKKTNEKSKTQKKTNKKSTQMPTNSPTNTKMMTVCHIPKRDPSACYDKSIRTSALKAHLDHGDLEGKCDSSCISFCASVGTCSEGNNLSRCICCDCKQECFTGTRVECEVGSINICRFNAELNTSETVCMAEASVSSHLRKHSSDYYGKCEEEIFVQNSVLLNVPPAQGTEEVDQYTLEYDVSFNEDGIVVLGKSFEIIDEVLCSSHQVDIFFPKPLAPGRLSSMFPTSAILVVNGDLFGTECSFVPPYEGSQRPTFNIGFLIIETSHVDGSIVTITGTPTIFDAIFEEQSMVYRASSSGKGIQRRSLFEFNLPEEEFEAKFPPEGPVQIVSKVTRSASISIGDSVFTSKWTRVGFLPKLLEATMYREIGYKMKVKNENSLEITGSAFEFKCPDEDNKFCPETEFSKVFPDFPIPGFGVSTPKFITKLLGINFSRLGLVFSIPVTLDFKIEAPISMKINLGGGTVDSGENRVRVGLTIKPSLGKRGVTIFKETLIATKATPSQEEEPEQNLVSLSPDLLKLEVHFGISPQLVLDFMNVAWASVGTFVGPEFTASLGNYPYPSSKGVGCDKCHMVDSNLYLIMKDLFFKHYVFGIGGPKPLTTVILAFSYKLVLGKLCLIRLENFVACGDRCCPPGVVCGPDKRCQAPGLCLSGCCGDNDCIRPSVCKSSTGLADSQCQCPYECCADGDCTIDGEFCDGITHQCTNESHDIHKQPHKIVHIGDAFSSGSGAKEYVEPQSCFRSNVNWGTHFSKTRGDYIAVQYINRASDGAEMKDYFENKYLGHLALLPEGCPTSKGDELIVKDGAVCKRYVHAQKSAITSDAELVLMTFGGKHFRRLVLQCLVTGFIQPQDCKTTLAEALDYATNKLKGDLVNVLLDVASRLKPGGKVLFSTYPHLIADVEYIIGNTEGDKFDARTAVRDLCVLIDQKQQDAINEANSVAVSKGGSSFALFFGRTKDLFAGHEPKPGLLEASDTLWINDSSAAFLSEEWYHPNAIGHKKWAEAIAKFIEGKIDMGGGGSTNTGASNVDLVFVIDATLSMQEEISDVRIAMADLTNFIATTSNSYRVAIVTYRDIELESEYPSKLNLDFTNDLIKIQGAIDGIELRSGGETFPETTLSGLNTALDLQYRPGVTKLIIAMGDEPPLMDDGKEPVTGLTVEYIVKKSNELDPVKVTAVNVGIPEAMKGTAIDEITDGTGGSIIELGTGGVVQAIKSILENTSRQPFAWIGEKIVAKTGEAMLFDASGSYDPFGLPITSYQWDFNGDKVFDATTTEHTIVYTYTDPFDDYVTLRVKSAAGVGVATAHVIVNDDGSVPQLGPELCEIDAVSGLPILEDADGNQLYCLTDSSKWPTENKPGVIVIVKDNKPMIESCLEIFSLPSIVNLQPCDARNKMRSAKRQVEIGDYSSACGTMHDMITLIGDTADACVEMCRNLNPTPSPTSKPRMKKPTRPITKPKIKPTKPLK